MLTLVSHTKRGREMNREELKKIIRSNDLVAMGRAIESGVLKSKTLRDGTAVTWIAKPRKNRR